MPRGRDASLDFVAAGIPATRLLDQRGLVELFYTFFEGTYGLLRQYLPKSTDLSLHSEDELAEIQRSLNGRPRKTLGFMTPLEKLNELIALTV